MCLQWFISKRNIALSLQVTNCYLLLISTIAYHATYNPESPKESCYICCVLILLASSVSINRDGTREEMLGGGANIISVPTVSKARKFLWNDAFQVHWDEQRNLEVQVMKVLTVYRNFQKFKCWGSIKLWGACSLCPLLALSLNFNGLVSNSNNIEDCAKA